MSPVWKWRGVAIAGVSLILLTVAVLPVSAQVPPTETELSLEIDGKGAISTVSEGTVVTGLVSCSEEAEDVEVKVEVKQKKDGEPKETYGKAQVDCDGPDGTPFRITTSESLSEGLATAEGIVYIYGSGERAEDETDVILQACSIIGSREDDHLRGSWRNDVVCGLGGADELYGRGGRDRLVGGDGSDYLSGGRGNDLLEGGPGSDWLVGGPGTDVCRHNRGGGSTQSCERK